MILTKDLILKYLDKANIKLEPIVGYNDIYLLKDHTNVVGEICSSYFRIGDKYYNFGQDYDGIIDILRRRSLTAFL